MSRKVKKSDLMEEEAKRVEKKREQNRKRQQKFRKKNRDERGKVRKEFLLYPNEVPIIKRKIEEIRGENE